MSKQKFLSNNINTLFSDLDWIQIIHTEIHQNLKNDDLIVWILYLFKFINHSFNNTKILHVTK